MSNIELNIGKSGLKQPPENHPKPVPTFSPNDLFLSPAGSDSWSGQLAEVTPDRGDGPLATLERARDLLRQRKLSGEMDGASTVWLRGGRYPITEPVVFTPADSMPVTFAAYPGEEPILSGGTEISGWEEGDWNGRRCWTVNLEPGTCFRQLFVNGRRAPRPRLPRVRDGEAGLFVMESVPGIDLDAPLFQSSEAFIAAPGDFPPDIARQDAEVVALHYWVEERMPVVSFDPQTRRVVCSRKSVMALVDESHQHYARYYVDNVGGALSEPGEWYLDRNTATLRYLPLPDETPENTRVFAPGPSLEWQSPRRLSGSLAPKSTRAIAPGPFQLLKLEGKPEDGQFVEFLRFVGITFEHADWEQPDGQEKYFPHWEWDVSRHPGVRYATAPQGACHVPGAIFLRGSRYCGLHGCVIQHAGWYGIEIAEGCTGNRVIGCTIRDCGAGGIKIIGTPAAGPASLVTGHNWITDNTIEECGQVFHSAAGILAIHTGHNTLSHNHIHDLHYSGISCGWVWGYAPNAAMENRIEKNHIHHIGRGWLSDMGGIYILGVQPGTVLRGNRIHDVERAVYGGWAIYLDEGSSHVLVENNVCYNTGSHGFHQHYGRENIVRNNIFALGREGQVAVTRGEAHLSYTLERNIILSHGQPLYFGGYSAKSFAEHVTTDLNILWDLSGELKLSVRQKDLPCWQEKGSDRHSIAVDPGFAHPLSGDFTLPKNSPAFALGFRQIDLSDVGPRSEVVEADAHRGVEG